MTSTGKFNEGIMEYILEALGFSDRCSEYSKQQLLATANQIHSNRVENVASTIKGFRGWEAVGSKFILHRVYGVDYIIEVKPSDEWVAFNFTINPDKAQEKIEKAREFTPLWKSLGVSKVIVLLTKSPHGEERDLSFYDKSRAEEDMLNVIFDAIEDENEVTLRQIEIHYDK